MTESLPVYVFGAPVVSFAVAWVTVSMLLRTFAGRMLDHPNERSLHQQPVPRTGGIGVAAGIAVSVPVVSPIEWWPLWLGAALLVGVSFVEDLAGLSIIGRLAAHFLAAGALAAGLLAEGLEWGWAAVVILPVVWMINLYNFMDGMDGLAGGMAVFGFGFLAVLSWVGDHQPLMLVSASIAAAAAAFVLFNFHPARIFLGDAGSTTLGFLAAGLGLTGWHYGVWSLWVPLLVFSPFIVDASVTLARRLMRGEKFWQAHRSHYYQRLVLSGWSHRRTALAEYGVMVCCGCGALVFQLASDTVRFGIVGIWALAFLGLAQSVSAVERRMSL
ncbi:MAG TPA: glycosyltransferase family 4 protein [Nitrospira sp.]|nr:glycosyltransferase family 4 protein [Nitrospira sp.]